MTVPAHFYGLTLYTAVNVQHYTRTLYNNTIQHTTQCAQKTPCAACCAAFQVLNAFRGLVLTPPAPRILIAATADVARIQVIDSAGAMVKPQTLEVTLAHYRVVQMGFFATTANPKLTAVRSTCQKGYGCTCLGVSRHSKQCRSPGLRSMTVLACCLRTSCVEAWPAILVAPLLQHNTWAS
jgi:hypothetical protein